MRLILIPTALERERIPLEMRRVWIEAGNSIDLCGFGATVSGIQAARSIAKHRPTQVILLGIAGSYSTEIPPGTAIEFTKVSLFGIGVGAGEEYLGAQDMGWMQWPVEPKIGDTIDLCKAATPDRELLSVTAASASSSEVETKFDRFPAALAEDMEGFSVAAACRLEQIPLRIIRGISNFAGNRNHREWKIDASLQAAMELLLQR